MEKTEAESVEDMTAASNKDSGKVNVTYLPNKPNNQSSTTNVEEMVLVGQDAKPQRQISQQASIGGVPIDVTLPFTKR